MATHERFLAGYTGPMPGTPEFKAARKAGETPIRDYAKTKRDARKAARVAGRTAAAAKRTAKRAVTGNTGIVPPAMGGSPVPARTRPAPIVAAASTLAGTSRKKAPLARK